MSTSESDLHKVITHPSNVTMVIYSHGQKPVALRRCRLRKLNAVEETRELSIHEVVTSDAPKCVDITEPLLHVISGREALDFTSMPGRYAVRVVIAYSEGAAPTDAEPHDFQVTCEHTGGRVLKLDATEIIS